MYFFLMAGLPMLSFLAIQSLLCRRGKKALIRKGLVIIPLVGIAAGVYMLAEAGGDYLFGGLYGLGAILWMIPFGSALCGYGLAWLIFVLAGKKTDSGNVGGRS